MNTFFDLKLPQTLTSTLQAMKLVNPTPIQQDAIPYALEGKDILGSAQTGTGKTLAFSIPLVTSLINDSKAEALVLVPTRELASQVISVLNSLLKGTDKSIRTALIIGGESLPLQVKQLKQRPRVIVGTPGRINDLLSRKDLSLKNISFLVLDETDRMLDMGFAPQLETIKKHFAAPRQTLLFSATLPSNIASLAQAYLNDPIRVAVGPSSLPAPKIKQDTIQIPVGSKYAQLLKELDNRDGSIIVFVKTRRNAESLALKLSKEHHKSGALHGALRQNKRERIIKSFRTQSCRIMIATDIAARGLDVSHVKHVINYDLPQCPEDYIHRIGRTGRAGMEGSALSFIEPGDNAKWKAIVRLLGGKESPSTPAFAKSEQGNGGNRMRRNRRPNNSKTHLGAKESNGNEAQHSPFFGKNKKRNENRSNNSKPHLGTKESNGKEAQHSPFFGKSTKRKATRSKRFSPNGAGNHTGQAPSRPFKQKHKKRTFSSPQAAAA